MGQLRITPGDYVLATFYTFLLECQYKFIVNRYNFIKSRLRYGILNYNSYFFIDINDLPYFKLQVHCLHPETGYNDWCKGTEGAAGCSQSRCIDRKGDVR